MQHQENSDQEANLFFFFFFFFNQHPTLDMEKIEIFYSEKEEFTI